MRGGGGMWGLVTSCGLGLWSLPGEGERTCLGSVPWFGDKEEEGREGSGEPEQIAHDGQVWCRTATLWICSA